MVPVSGVTFETYVLQHSRGGSMPQPSPSAALQRTTSAVRPEEQESEEEEPWAPVSAVLVRWSPPAVLVRWRYRYPAAADAADQQEEEDALHFRVFYQEVHDKSSGRVAVASGEQRSVLLERLQPEAEYLVRVFARASPSLATRANRTTDAPVGLVRFVAPGTAATAKRLSARDLLKLASNSGVVASRTVVVRDEEIVIVVLVLSVWLAVILLFFNKWGKIRMLEPYQPQYHEQLEPDSPPVLQNCDEHHVKSARCEVKQWYAKFVTPSGDVMPPSTVLSKPAQVKSVVLERELRRLSSNANGSGVAALHRLHRLRHNSVFVGSQILVPLSRRAKSAEDIKSMVLQIEHQPSTQSTAL
ncbi:hypothetical protein HPB49_021371 [Dermacentor silvarum]|uniref:Uncharacterized protein n=1 Tax=Dermacentor silvarum TaxID=543639 RepID=A0ACB8CZZ7_DERSI|nr:hypothetical protein HPB49_021371 [Dermacentor silvarum]